MKIVHCSSNNTLQWQLHLPLHCTVFIVQVKFPVQRGSRHCVFCTALNIVHCILHCIDCLPCQFPHHPVPSLPKPSLAISIQAHSTNYCLHTLISYLYPAHFSQPIKKDRIIHVFSDIKFDFLWTFHKYCFHNDILSLSRISIAGEKRTFISLLHSGRVSLNVICFPE